MSAHRSEQRKSTNLTQESFEKEWEKLEEYAKAANTPKKPYVPKLNFRDVNGSGSEVKARDKSAWKLNQSDQGENSAKALTQTQTSTTAQTTTTTQTDPMAHTAPVITPRKQTTFAPETSSDGGPSHEKTSARSEKAVDSPRRTKILSRESAKSKRSGSPSVSTTTTPSSSPAVTPREQEKIETDSPRSQSAGRFKKAISNKFSKMAIDLSKINPDRHSPPASPKSTGRISPSKKTPRKKESAFIKSLSHDVRNSAAKALISLNQDSNFSSANETKKKFKLNSQLIGILTKEGHEIDENKLKELAEDAEIRSANYMIDVDIELGEEPHKSNFILGAKKFDNHWQKEWDMAITEYSAAPEAEKKIAHKKFLSTFIKDYYRNGVSHELLLPDGSSRPFNSLEEMALFLNGDDDSSHRSRYVSNVTSQNFSIFAQQLACGGLPGTTSPVKIYDGTPLIPRGRSEQKYIYSKDDNGIISVRAKISMFADDTTRSSQMQDDNHTPVSIDKAAWLTIESELIFETDDEWSIYDIRLKGQGWSLPTEKL